MTICGIWRLVRCLMPMACLLFLARGAAAEDAPKGIPFAKIDRKEPVVFDKDIFPILAEKCISCHDAQGGLAEGDLDLLTVAAIEKGGKKGAAIIKGKGEESLLVKLAAHLQKPVMPPDDEEPLTSEQLTLLKLWIDQGAKPGEDLEPAKAYFGDDEVMLGPLPPGVHPVYALDLTNDGRLLAAGRANQVFVYDAATGALMAQLPGHLDIVQSVAFSPDQRWLATGGYQKVLIWQVPRPVEVSQLAGHSGPTRALAISHDQKWLASGSDDKSVRLWELASGNQVRTFDGHDAPVQALAFSADDKYLATGGDDGKVRVFAVADGKLLNTLEGHSGKILSVAFDPQGQKLATGGQDGEVRLWDLQTRLNPPAENEKQEVKPADVSLKGHSKPIHFVAWLKDQIVSASEDGTVRFWDQQKQIRELNTGAPVVAMAIDPKDGTLATADNQNHVKVWNAEGQPLRTFTLPKAVTAVALSEGALTAGCEDNVIRSWDAKTGQLFHVATGHAGPVRSLSGWGLKVASGSDDKSVRVWDLSQRWSEPKELASFAERVLALSWSPDGKRLATGAGVPAASGELKIWDPEKGEVVLELEDAHSDTVFAVAFSPDGKHLLSGAADKFVKVHETESGKHVKSFEGHTHHVLGVAWKADGKVIASAGADNVIKTWDFETGEQIRTIAGHNKQVTGVQWVGKTDKLISSCADRSVRLINSGNGRAERAFGGAADFLYCVDVSEDGNTIVSGCEDGKIFIWDQNAKLLHTLNVESPVATQAKAN